MDGQAKIKTAFERNAQALTLRSSLGKGTAVTKVRLRGGLACELEDGPWKLTVDMAEKSGGNNSGPNPGVLGRGALASCLAIGYATWAAVLGVQFSTLEVEVQADYDVRGEHGFADVHPGYSEIRYVVTFESDASEADILRVLDKADAHSSYHDVFRRAIELRREVRVVTPSG